MTVKCTFDSSSSVSSTILSGAFVGVVDATSAIAVGGQESGRRGVGIVDRWVVKVKAAHWATGTGDVNVRASLPRDTRSQPQACDMLASVSISESISSTCHSLFQDPPSQCHAYALYDPSQ